MTRKDSFILLLTTYCDAYHPISEPSAKVGNIYQALKLDPHCIPIDILVAIEDWVAWRVAMSHAVKWCETRPEPPSWVVLKPGPDICFD